MELGRDVVLLLIGAAIGVCSSIATLFLERWFNRRGKIRVFYKISSGMDMGRRAYGFYEKSDGTVSFRVPVILEIQNTSNATRVIRDVNLALYQDNQRITGMYQVTSTGKPGDTETIFYGAENQSYSFVLEAVSIQKQKCLFTLNIPAAQAVDRQFNRVVLEYYDEKDRRRKAEIDRIVNCWKPGRLDGKEDWHEIVCKG